MNSGDARPRPFLGIGLRRGTWSTPPPGSDLQYLIHDSDGLVKLYKSDGTKTVVGSLGLTRYVARDYGITPENPDNGPAINALCSIIRALGSGKAGSIVFEGATYDVSTPLVDSADDTKAALEWLGMPGTKIRAVGAAIGNGALPNKDLLTLSSFNFTCRNIEFTAASTMTVFTRQIVVNGMANISAVIAGANKLQNILFENCHLTSGFDGLLLQDNPGNANLSVVGFTWKGPSWARNFAAGGNIVDVASHWSVVVTIDIMTHLETPGVASASRPNCSMRIRDSADIRLRNFESIYAKNGLLAEPASGKRCNTIFATNVILGGVASDGYALKMAPNAGAEFLFHNWEGCWLDSGTVGLLIQGSAVKDAKFVGLTIGGGCVDGIVVDAVTDLSQFEGTSITGCSGHGFWAKNSAKNFRLTGGVSAGGGTTATGVQVDALSDSYDISMVGGSNCTTPLTNTPGNAASRNAVVR